jgi:hypothetical protein
MELVDFGDFENPAALLYLNRETLEGLAHELPAQGGDEILQRLGQECRMALERADSAGGGDGSGPEFSLGDTALAPGNRACPHCETALVTEYLTMEDSSLMVKVTCPGCGAWNAFPPMDELCVNLPSACSIN